LLRCTSPLAGRPRRLALPALLVGGIAIGFSPIFVRLSELGPIATGFYRLLLALPLLWLWMHWEGRVNASAALGARYVQGDMLGLITACFFGSYVVAVARRANGPVAA
jgi:hypothetical protein